MKSKLYIIFTLCVIFLFCCISNISIAINENENESADISENIGYHWVNPYLNNLKINNIIDADEISFNEYDVFITRWKFVDLLMRVLFYDNIEEQISENTVYFIDVASDSIYYSQIINAYSVGIVNGYPDGSFCPDDYIERQDIFTIIGRAYENELILHNSLLANETDANEFSDRGLIADYAVKYVNLLQSISLIVGYEDNTIRPEANITYAEALVLIDRIYMMNQSYMLDNESAISDDSIVKDVLNGSDRSAKELPSNTKNAFDEPENNVKTTVSNNVNSSMGNNNYSNNGNYNNQNNGGAYDFNDSFESDIEKLISLKNIKSIKFVSALSHNNSIMLNSNVEIVEIINTLRSIKLYKASPLYNYYTGGGNTIQITFDYGNNLNNYINVNRAGIYIDDLFYPFLFFNDGQFIERQIANTLTKKDKNIANLMFPDITGANGNDAYINLTNSHQMWQLVNYQMPNYSMEFNLISEQAAILLDSLNTTDNNIYFIDNFYKVYQIELYNNVFAENNIQFNKMINNNNYYWIASLISDKANVGYSVAMNKDSSGKWGYAPDYENDEQQTTAYNLFNNIFKASMSEKISYNVSSSQLGIYFDSLAQNIEDVRLVEITNCKMYFIYVKTSKNEYAYVLSIGNYGNNIKQNSIYTVNELLSLRGY